MDRTIPNSLAKRFIILDVLNKTDSAARKSMKDEYRNQALKILPWVCAKCAREFSGKKLRDLTVHHKDHNYKNNPPDGSNWELLCIYCHDNEHSRSLESEWLNAQDSGGEKKPEATHTPFAKLKGLMNKP